MLSVGTAWGHAAVMHVVMMLLVQIYDEHDAGAVGCSLVGLFRLQPT